MNKNFLIVSFGKDPHQKQNTLTYSNSTCSQQYSIVVGLNRVFDNFQSCLMCTYKSYIDVYHWETTCYHILLMVNHRWQRQKTEEQKALL